VGRKVLLVGPFDERIESADLVSVEDDEVHSGHGVRTLGRSEGPRGPDRITDRGSRGEGEPRSGEARLQGITETFQCLIADELAVRIVEVRVGAEKLLERRSPGCAV
jgi:hypothetical protein